MLEKVSDLIREVAATEVLPRFRHLGDDEIKAKAPGDLVTIADQVISMELQFAGGPWRTEKYRWDGEKMNRISVKESPR